MPVADPTSSEAAVTAIDPVAVVARFIAAVEAGDIDAVRATYHPDATVWHNTDGIDQPVEDNLKVLAWMGRHFPTKRYTDIVRHPIVGGVVEQHVLVLTGPDGTTFSMPACLVVLVDGDGLVTRVEEYLDGAQAAELVRYRPVVDG